MFQIERLRDYVAGYKPPAGRPHRVFEHSGNGFLVTGYDDGSDWLVSPTGRLTHGKLLSKSAGLGWAIGQDRRDFHLIHLYVLNIREKSYKKVSNLPLRFNDYSILEYDSERLVVICHFGAGREDPRREIVIVDIATAAVMGRFTLGYEVSYRRQIGQTPDGWLVLQASRLGENGERLYQHGIARIHPLARTISFEIFPASGRADVLVSPSGQYVLKADKAVPGAADTVDGAARLEVWAGNPLCHVRDLQITWAGGGKAWKFPEANEIHWQPNEMAFWLVRHNEAICVGLDGRPSPLMRLNTSGSICTPLPGRMAEFTRQRETDAELYRLDGAPSDESLLQDAPAPIVVEPSAAEQKRQRSAQTALTKIVTAKSDLKFTLRTPEPDELLDAIDAITAALDRGLGWFADEQGTIKVSIKIGDSACHEKRFFGLVENLGIAAAPALKRLLAKCCLDADLPQVWSDPEAGRQAFGFAARALGGIDPSAWLELAEYEKCIDDWHELYFRNEVVPHFIAAHGWCAESFALALADIVQVRGNLGDDFTYPWRRSGLAAAAEASYAPDAFAALMLNIRDRMLASAGGTFATFIARIAENPRSLYGWPNYDRLFHQIKDELTPWEALLFRSLQDRTVQQDASGATQ